MTFFIRVTIDVVNELGEKVNYKGYPKSPNQSKFTPIETKQIIGDYDDPKFANSKVNNVFNIIKAITEMQGVTK